MLSNGSTGRYLKYAVGEILLVMIGILLALQVNNWNERRKSRLVEADLLTELSKSVEEDIDGIKVVIEQNQNYIKSAEIVLKTLDNNSPFNDSIANYFNNALKVWRVYIKTSAYDNLKEYGLHVIKDVDTRKEIIRAYSARTKFVEELYDRYDQFMYNVVEPVLAVNTELKEVEEYGFILFPLNNDGRSDHHQLKYLLHRSINMKNQIIRAKERTLRSFENLQEGLKREMKS